MPEFEVDWCLRPILGYFSDLGATYGEQVIPYHEIESWARQEGVAATPFIVGTLRRMSVAYINMQHAAKAADCPNPTKPEETTPLGRRPKPEEDEAPAASPQHKRLKRKAR